MRWIAIAVVAASICLVGENAPAIAGSKTKIPSKRWAICLNPSNPKDLIPAAKNADLLIVDPDTASAVPEIRMQKAKLIGYVSAGEAENYRAYWPRIKDASWRLQENPDWPGNYPVDPRAPEWRKVVIDEARRILSNGYAGIFLDTMESAAFLEESDPKRFEGAVEAAVRTVRVLRALFPDALILVNHAPSLLGRTDAWVDGVTVEDLHSRWEGTGYRMSSSEERRDLDEPYRAFHKRTHKPVMVIDYCGEKDVRCAKKSLRASQKAGFIGFVATKELDRILPSNR